MKDIKTVSKIGKGFLKKAFSISDLKQKVLIYQEPSVFIRRSTVSFRIHNFHTHNDFIVILDFTLSQVQYIETLYKGCELRTKEISTECVKDFGQAYFG